VRRVKTAADAAAWARLRVDFIRQSPPPVAWDEATLALEIEAWLTERLARRDVATFLGEVDGEPAGIGAVSIYEVPLAPAVSGTEAYISSMYTEPRFRGLGVARVVLDELIVYAHAAGVRGRVWLRATDAGRPLYASAGFLPRDYFMQLRLTD
jgi:GNAT superfamily N-acetyltransferase